MGMFAEALKESAIQVAHSFDVETDPTSRAVARANHDIDHESLPQDLWQVTDDHTDDLVAKHGKIDLVIATTPCQGLSSANDKGTGLQDHRSSLFYKAMDIIQHLRAQHRETKFIVENVDFRVAHPEDYMPRYASNWAPRNSSTPNTLPARTGSACFGTTSGKSNHGTSRATTR